ncbi:uncharacterized protein B0J16DRAFT_329357 [Fusarium flagelliforme]|uniref:uncharacterized protein n=1 Tax=Fusarium flagelliforme TaxID=2675880 RepID=UPI001E8CE417|nr:uncharacterized protein B0J16DRAFT_329357 [Fusarium flagelliforme]KAH7197927.1 hypothetical protein B0J16DRAFT_329357 [Fusarium flagelliforme]
MRGFNLLVLVGNFGYLGWLGTRYVGYVGLSSQINLRIHTETVGRTRTPREECKVSAVTIVMLTAEAMTRTPPSLATL